MAKRHKRKRVNNAPHQISNIILPREGSRSTEERDESEAGGRNSFLDPSTSIIYCCVAALLSDWKRAKKKTKKKPTRHFTPKTSVFMYKYTHPSVTHI